MSRFSLLALVGLGFSFIGTLFLASWAVEGEGQPVILLFSFGLLALGVAAAAAAHGGFSRRPLPWAIVYPVLMAGIGGAGLVLSMLTRAFPSFFLLSDAAEPWIALVQFTAIYAFVRWAKSDGRGGVRWWP